MERALLGGRIQQPPQPGGKLRARVFIRDCSRTTGQAVNVVDAMGDASIGRPLPEESIGRDATIRIRWLPKPPSSEHSDADYPGSADLPSLYQSKRATLPYFRIHGLLTDAGACLSTEPHHIVYFRVEPDGRARISNELISLDPETATSMSRAIFSACPGVDSVVWTHIRGDLSRCSLPHLVQEVTQNWRIDLPPRPENGAQQVLPRSTRKHRNAKWNRLRRAFPDAESRVIDKEDIDAALVHELVEMNRKRLSQKQLVSGFDSDSLREPRLVQSLKNCGFGVLLHADGKLIAGLLCSMIDAACFTELVGIDQDYEPFSPGMMCFWTAIEGSVQRGAVSMHLGWGTEGYKQRLGAYADDLWTATLYRSRGAQLRHWREAWTVAHHKVRRGAEDARYATRRVAGRVAKRSLAKLGWRPAQGSPEDPQGSSASTELRRSKPEVAEAAGDVVDDGSSGERR